MKLPRWTVALALTLIGSIGWATSARAEAEPKVVDDAHFFKAETIEKANEQLKQLKNDTGVEMVVETFPNIPEDKRAAYDSASSKDEFYANWVRERARNIKLYGVFVLIVKDPAHLHVLSGKATGQKAFPHSAEVKLRDTLTSEFKQKNFDQGLLKGIEQATQTIKENLGGEKLKAAAAGGHDPIAGGPSPGPSPGSSAGANPIPQGPGPQASGSIFHGSCMWIVLIVIGVIFLFSIIRRSTGGGYNQGYGQGGGYIPPGSPGYGYGPGPARGGGFLSGLFGGLLGGAAGSYFENRYENRGQGGGNFPTTGGGGDSGGSSDQGAGGDFGSSDTGAGGDFGSSSSGSDFGSSGGDSGGSGGDFGGGGDSGGGGGSGGDF